MAAWQADFTLEPDLTPLPADFCEQLDRLLPRGRAWSAYQESWGAEDSDCIDVWPDPQGTTEVRCRIDVRKLDPAWLERFVAFMRHTHRRLETPDGRGVGSDLGELTLVLRGSPAWRFVEDPEAYVRRIRLGSYEDG